MKVEYAKVTLDQDGVSIRELEEKEWMSFTHHRRIISQPGS